MSFGSNAIAGAVAGLAVLIAARTRTSMATAPQQQADTAKKRGRRKNAAYKALQQGGPAAWTSLLTRTKPHCKGA